MASIEEIATKTQQAPLIPAAALATQWGVREDDWVPEWTEDALAPAEPGADFASRLIKVQYTEETARAEARRRYHSVKLIRQTGDGPIETVPYDPPRLQVLTYSDPAWTLVNGIHLMLLGDDECVIALGEQDRAEFLTAVRQHLIEQNCGYGAEYDPVGSVEMSSIEYRIAARQEPWGFEDSDWVIRWPADPPLQPTEPNVFWITKLDLN